MRPLSWFFVTVLSLTALANGTAQAPAATTPAPRDIRVATAVTVDYDGQAHTSFYRSFISGSLLRMESGTKAAPSDSLDYQLYNAVDSTLSVVSRPWKSVDVNRLRPNRLPDLGVDSMTISDVTKNQIEDLGSGGILLGRETRHYRVTRAATIHWVVRGHPCSRKSERIEELWITTDPVARALIDSAEERTQRIMMFSGGSGQNWSGLFDSVTHSTPPTGLALRTIGTFIDSTSDGKATRDLDRFEYVELSSDPIDPSAFAVPSGLRVSDLRRQPSTRDPDIPTPGGGCS